MARSTLKTSLSFDEIRAHGKTADNVFTLVIKVKPNASVDQLTINAENELVLSVRAPAVDNAANTRVVELLAQLFFVPRSKISIAKGTHARVKTVVIKT